MPHVNVIHFQSDGPSTQYKNKSNFYLFRYHCEKLNLQLASYTFTTPGHGKSSADGTGGTVKCFCDRCVHQGHDIVSAADMVELIAKAELKVQMFLITTQDIEDVDKILRKVIPIPETKKTFQLIWSNKDENRIYTNNLSCFECLGDSPCKHYAINQTGFLFKEAISKTSKKADENSKKWQVAPKKAKAANVLDDEKIHPQSKKVPKKKNGDKKKENKKVPKKKNGDKKKENKKTSGPRKPLEKKVKNISRTKK